MHNLNLKAYLANIGMTMTEFCQIIECDRAYLSCVSSGRVRPGPRLAKEIYNATGGVVNIPSREKKKKIHAEKENT